MDWRKILIEYAKTVGSMEGTTFRLDIGMCDLSDDERAALNLALLEAEGRRTNG